MEKINNNNEYNIFIKQLNVFKEKFKLLTCDPKKGFTIIDIDLNDLFDVDDVIKSKISIKLSPKYIYIYRKDIRYTYNDAATTFDKVQVCRIKLDKDFNFLNIESELSNKDELLISETFDMLKDIAFFKYIQEKFNIKKINDQDIKQLELIKKEIKNRVDEVGNIEHEIHKMVQSNDSNRKTLDINNDESVLTVHQRQIGFLNEDDKQRYIETIGAGPCYIAVSYNRNDKKVALAHVDELTDIKFVFDRLSKYGDEISLFGGDETSKLTFVSIKQYLDKKNIKLKQWDLFSGKKHIIVDKETGIIYNAIPKERNKIPDHVLLKISIGVVCEKPQIVLGKKDN